MNVLGKEINIYPNPATDRIYIQSPAKINATLTGITGKVIRQIENASYLSVKNLASGLYLLRITNQEGTLIKVEKVIKQNK